MAASRRPFRSVAPPRVQDPDTQRAFDELTSALNEALEQAAGIDVDIDSAITGKRPRPLAAGRIAPAGEFSSQHGCESVTRTATGVFEIVTTERWSADEISIVATGRDSGGDERRVTVGALTPLDRTIEFTARDGSGAANNAEINFAVFLV